MKIARGVLGVLAGFAAAVVCMLIAEQINHRLYPFPPGADMSDPATIKRYLPTLPATAFVLVIVGWLVGALLGTFLAVKIGRSPVPGYIVGALLFLGGIANALMIPQPLWFSAIGLVIFLTVPFLAVRMAGPPSLQQA